MPVPKLQFTAVRAARGTRVHALAWIAGNRVACGRVSQRWCIATRGTSAYAEDLVDCPDCKDAIARPRR